MSHVSSMTFFTVTKDSNKLSYTSILNKDLRRKIIFQKSNFTNTGQQSLIFAFLHTPSLLKLANGNPLRKITHMYNLYRKSTFDKRHYIFHCVHVELVKARRNFFSKLASINRFKVASPQLWTTFLTALLRQHPMKLENFSIV